MAIKKRTAKDKDRDKDRFLSGLHMPYEGVFSKRSKRARYRGTVKVYFQSVMEAIVHNVKRLVTIGHEAVALGS